MNAFSHLVALLDLNNSVNRETVQERTVKNKKVFELRIVTCGIKNTFELMLQPDFKTFPCPVHFLLVQARNGCVNLGTFHERLLPVAIRSKNLLDLCCLNWPMQSKGVNGKFEKIEKRN